jgi:uncharacterized membrane protein YqjE
MGASMRLIKLVGIASGFAALASLILVLLLAIWAKDPQAHQVVGKMLATVIILALPVSGVCVWLYDRRENGDD